MKIAKITFLLLFLLVGIKINAQNDKSKAETFMSNQLETELRSWSKSWAIDEYIHNSMVVSLYSNCTLKLGSIWKILDIDKNPDIYSTFCMYGYFYIKRPMQGKVKAEFRAFEYVDEYGKLQLLLCYKDNMESRCNKDVNAWPFFK